MKNVMALAVALSLFSTGGALAVCGDDALEGSWEYFQLGSDNSVDYCVIRVTPNRIISRVICREIASDFPDSVEEDLLNARVFKANCRFQFRDSIVPTNCRYFGALVDDGRSGSGVGLCNDGTRYHFSLVKR